MTSAFQVDCERKRNYQDPQLRWTACATCGVIRKFHYDLGHKFRRMTDREWREYCGTDGIAEAPYSRAVVIGQGRIELECGHWQDTAFADALLPGTFTDCKQCEKEKRMGWLNGKAVAMDAPENGWSKASVPPPALAESDKQTALIVPDNKNGSTAEVARFLPVMDIQQAVARRDVIVQAMKQLMVDGVDYGKIPGGERPALMKPGAEKLCNLFGLTIRYRFDEKVEDWSGERHGGEPFFYYQLLAQVYRGDFLIAEGLGSCNSWEAKYRWRKGERTCPECGQSTIIKGRAEFGGGWLCFKKKGGCGKLFLDGDQTIEGQQVGRKPNPDVADQVNTILKMARKRAMVDGVVNATSASEFFTQDVEDFTPPQEDIDIGGRQPNSRSAQQYVAEQKIRTGNIEPIRPGWKNMAEMAKAFEGMRTEVGETAWGEELERYGWRDVAAIRNALDAIKGAGPAKDAVKAKVLDLYRHLEARKEGK